MGDHWEGWIDDGPDFGTGPDADPDFAATDGYPVEGFGPADEHGDDAYSGGGAGEEDLDGPGPETTPIGYGDEPFTVDAGYPADTGFGPAEHDTGLGPADLGADTGFGSVDGDTGPGAADGDTGFGPGDVDAQVGFGAAPVGADPDLDPYGDSWPPPAFPDALDSGGVPEPVDGFPWADPDTLGDPDTPPADPATYGVPEPAELAGYAAEEVPPGVDPWTALAGSDDPATGALARFWGTRDS
ncbi:hypothetical protein OG792_16335 [Micromonospora sp. NBC_01699]|uniref:hypothetical protein n=1 Tax=Micromonospora sp. NBC_01699 TaxID=2975984 RepID=UPI002E351BF7|nr:hypothetical protein [Micromonospora sp. NBC_01699]